MSDLPPQYQLVVDVWRAATDSAALDECVDRVAAMLARTVRADSLAIWRLARDSDRLESVAASAVRPGPRPAPATRDIAASVTETLCALQREGAPPLTTPGVVDDATRLFAPDGSWRAMAIAPLAEGDRALGFVVLAARNSGVLDASHAELLGQLAPPLGTALRLEDEREHEHRLR